MTHDAASACSLVLQVALEDAPRGQKTQTPGPPEGAVSLYEGSMATQQSRRAGRASASEEQWSSTQSSSSSVHVEEAKGNSPPVRSEVPSRPTSMTVSKNFSYAQALKTTYPKVEGSVAGSMLGSPCVTPSDSPCQSKMALRSESATPASSMAISSPTPSVGSRKLVSPLGGSGGGQSQDVEVGGAGEEEEEEVRSGRESSELPAPVLVASQSVDGPELEGECEDGEKGGTPVCSPDSGTATSNAVTIVQEEPTIRPSDPPQPSPSPKDTCLQTPPTPPEEDKGHKADDVVTSEPRIADMKVAPAPPVVTPGASPPQGAQGDIKPPPGLPGHAPGIASTPLLIQNLTDHQKLLTQQRMLAAGHRMFSLGPPPQARMAARSVGSLMPVPPAALLTSVPPQALPTQHLLDHHHQHQQQQQQQQQGLLEHQTARHLQDMAAYHHHHHQQQQQQQQQQPHPHPHHPLSHHATPPVSFGSAHPAGSVPSRALLGNQPTSLSRQQLETFLYNILLQEQQQQQQQALQKHLLQQQQQQQQQQHALQKQHNLMLQQHGLVSKVQMEKVAQHGSLQQHSVSQHGIHQHQHGVPHHQHGVPQHSITHHGVPQHSVPQHGIEERKQQQQQQNASAQLYQQANPGATGKSEAPSAPYLLHNPHLPPHSVPMARTPPSGLAMGLQPSPQQTAAMFAAIQPLRGLLPAQPPPQQLALDPSPPLREPVAFPLAPTAPAKEVTSDPSGSSEMTVAALDSGRPATTSSDSSDDHDQTESQKGSSLSITATPFIPMSGGVAVASAPGNPLQSQPQSQPQQPPPQHDLARKIPTNTSYEMGPTPSSLPAHVQTHTALLYPAMGGGRGHMVPHTHAVQPSSMLPQMVTLPPSQVAAGRPAYQVISPQAERPVLHHRQHGLVAMQRQLSGGGAERRGQEHGRNSSKEHSHYRLPMQQQAEQVGVVPAGMGNPLDAQGRQILPQKAFAPYGMVGVPGGGVHGKVGGEPFGPVGRAMVSQQQQQQQEAVLKQAQALHMGQGAGSKRPLLPTPLAPHTPQTWPPGGRPPVVPPHKLYPARNIPYSTGAGLLGGMTAYPRNPI